ncbi:sulfotransferase [Plakobranchus ocellatus]|uniref:Sulfotransferase n=1 Tax=Plakobranchus ocellatus TaxID=259542 RepID=A0AAV3Y062_9GAST|nr:sulfotransferase [Plakobranchus ocellatus]
MNDIDFEKASKINIEHRFPYFEYPMPGLDVIAETPSPRLIKSHLPFSILPNQMDKKKPKTIYVARNPKDTIVSYYWFGIKFLNVVPFNGSFEDYCRLFVTDQVAYGPWWKHVTEAWKRKDDENMLFLFYEDLQTDARKCVKQIAEFLGKSFTEEQIDLVVQHCNFDSMKKNRSVNYEWMKDDGIANKDEAFLRSGKVGDWRNHLSEDIVKQLDEIVATKLPADMREYIRDSLPEK